MFVYLSTVYFCVMMLWLFAANKDVFQGILLTKVVIKILVTVLLCGTSH